MPRMDKIEFGLGPAGINLWRKPQGNTSLLRGHRCAMTFLQGPEPARGVGGAPF